MHRSQVSLIIGDDKLYTDFVKPLSTEKKLMPLIVKLLGSYFYNTQVQQLVDGVSIDSLKEQQDFISDENRDLQEMLQDMRASVQYFGMCISDTNATLEEGMEMVSSFAKETGGTSSDFSSGNPSVPRLSVKNLEKMHSQVSQVNQERVEPVSCKDPRFDSLQKDVEEMKGSLGQILSLLQNGAVPVSSKSVSESEVSEVRMDVKENKPITDNISSSEGSVISESTDEEREAGKSILQAMLKGGGIGGFS